MARQQYLRKKAALRSRLSQLWASALKVVPHARRVVVVKELTGTPGHQHFDRKAHLSELLTAMASLGMAEDRLATLAKELMAVVFRPVLEGSVSGGGTNGGGKRGDPASDTHTHTCMHHHRLCLLWTMPTRSRGQP